MAGPIPRATRPELNYERLASRHQHVAADTQRLQVTTKGSQSRQAARVRQQNRTVCALRPSLVSMVTGCRAGRARGPAGVFASANNLYTTPDNLTSLLPSQIASVGGSQAHENMQPFLTINFCIALVGIFPSQN